MSRLLPLSPANALKFISYASLFGCYSMLMLLCLRMGLGKGSAFLGLVAIWSSYHLHCYHNPYLTDAFGLLMLCTMLCALVERSFLLFAVAALLGVLTRETCIFVVPIWLVTRQFKRSFALLGGLILVLVALRVVLAPDFVSNTLGSIASEYGLLHLQHPLFFCRAVLHSYGFVWFVSLAGLWFLSVTRFLDLAFAGVCLFCGALLTAAIVNDVERMFLILTPVCVIASAQFFELLARQKRHKLTFVLLIMCGLSALTTFPNKLIEQGSLVFGSSAQNILLATEMAAGCLVMLSLWGPLSVAVKEKTSFLIKDLQETCRALHGRILARKRMV